MAKKGKNKPTGFEEFYADPPRTSDEAEEECKVLYSSDRPFSERMQTCIQRYRARRKLDEVRANVFNKYLILGGVEATNKMFTGGALDEETLATATAAEIAAVQASDFIRPGGKKYYDPTNPNGWVVDFEGVAKGFFSYKVPTQLPINTQKEIQLYSMIIRNFLNYVLHHEVCVEYVEDVMAARRICGLAEQELWAITQITQALPGNFNVALSTLFGGRFQGMYDPNAIWRDENEGPSGMSLERAKEVMDKGIKSLANHGIVWKSANMICKSATRYYEVISTESAIEGSLGVINCKPWVGPQLDHYDIKEPIPSKNETFYVESELIKLMEDGMKIEAVVRQLDNGFKFFESAGFFCSFYSFPENEKMMNYKEPDTSPSIPATLVTNKYIVLCTRPGPTEDDANAEERAVEGEMAQMGLD